MRDCEDEQISLAKLASECRLSRSHFARAFKKSTGQSPHRWLLERRLGTAKQMLVDTKSSISDIAFASGFADQSHLTRVFSKMVARASRRLAARNDQLTCCPAPRGQTRRKKPQSEHAASISIAVVPLPF